MAQRTVSGYLLKALAIVGVAIGLFVLAEPASAHSVAQSDEPRQMAPLEPASAPEQGHHTPAGSHVNCHSFGVNCHAFAAMNSTGENINSSKASKLVELGALLKIDPPLFLPFRPPIAG